MPGESKKSSGVLWMCKNGLCISGTGIVCVICKMCIIIIMHNVSWLVRGFVFWGFLVKMSNVLTHWSAAVQLSHLNRTPKDGPSTLPAPHTLSCSLVGNTQNHCNTKLCHFYTNTLLNAKSRRFLELSNMQIR